MNEHEPLPAPERSAAMSPLDAAPLANAAEAGDISHEAQPRDGPRIYVASLSDYNNGLLHGRWIDAVDDTEVMQGEIDEMLAASPTMQRYGDLAEEWAIHDYDGFGQLRLGEHHALSTIARLADGIEEHGLAFTAWADYVGTDSDELDRFEEVYRGEWDSVEAYAEQLLEDFGVEGILESLPDWMAPYVEFDSGAFARDLELSGDVVAIPTPEHSVLVFEGR